MISKLRLPNIIVKSFVLSAFLFASQSQAEGGFGIDATRIIFLQDKAETTVSVRNTTTNIPYLVTTKITRTVDGNGKAPFYVSPPLFRLDPKGTNVLRILGDTSKLPTDRESVFYFNASAIPGRNPPGQRFESAKIGGGIAYAIGNTIKLFYRPTGLAGTPEQAYKALRFTHAAGGIQVSNNSPYHISFTQIKVDGVPVKFSDSHPQMLAPFSTHVYPAQNSQNKKKVEWAVINDLGGGDNFNGTIQ
ncbi:molecular chaperone [Photorhabdus temperata]|uniref:P pilus assembly protein, chaperone PapD n=3 Tax=Photorhabdus temperata TaxID=574560 RepID=A0A081S040_PHOTE|nr:molecular chaperone [Photorhabdus temperata]ERT13304.1 fimbrial chaperone [Photorhabdus temperata J3]KER04293.1 P pilus assembly protein, chaperone PapD [Photorhabdus temperata subsp. temperata Meg1]MCT8346130.1 molecular chaperone [Photorhabdus temperata]